MRRHLGFWFNAVLVLLLVACLGFLSTRWGFVADWSAGSRASLAPQSRALLEQLPGELAVTSYASPGSGLRPTIAAFIDRYQRFKPDLTFRFVDPEQDPAAMRAAGITIDGELVMTYQGQQQRLDQLSDESFSNALARLARGGERMVAFVTGHGERRATGHANADIGTFVAQLESRGVRALPLSFAEVSAVPQTTDLLVLASPLVPVPAGAAAALVDYVRAGGNLLWLTEPDARDLGLTPLAAELGIEVLPGMLVDAQGAAIGLSDPRMLAPAQYPAHAITEGFLLTTLYPQVAPLVAREDSGWSAAPLLLSGARSWNERQAIDNTNSSTIRFDTEVGETRGPLAFAFALSRARPGADAGEQRVVVIGDGDFLSNSFLGNGGNRALGERVFDWLLGDADLVSLPPRSAPDRHVQLTQTGLGALAFGFLILLPLLLLGVAGVTAFRRRRR